MSITKVSSYSFKGRLYLNRNDLNRSSSVTYEQIKNVAKGQVIESPRKGGFYWIRIDDKDAKPIVKECQKSNILYMYLPGEISYKEFEKFAHSTNW